MSQSFSLTLLIACLAVFLATAVGESVVHRRHLSWMTESGVAIIVGLAIGFVFFLYEMLTTNDQTQLDAASRRLEFLEFDPVFFTLVLLPPIIFESGYNLNHSFFFSNLGGILALAFAGTLIATGVTAFSLYWGLGGPQGLLTPMESAAFAALISAVDPVATLAIFSSTGADPKLNALIFGESVLNDAVAIVLFKTLVEMGVSTNLGIGGWEAMTAASVFSVVGKFLLIFCGSLLVGVCSGMATALAFKLVRLRDLHADSAAPAELICLICLSYASFMLAELGGLSGIVSALFSGAVSVTFVQHNLTPEGAALCKTAVKTLARFTETIVFLLIGTGFWLYTLGSVERGPANATAAAEHAEAHARRVLSDTVAAADASGAAVCRAPAHDQIDVPFVVLTIVLCLIARAASVFPVTFIVNRLRKKQHRIKPNEQAVIWFSGLRGAIALALAVDFPQYGVTAGQAGAGNFCYQRDHVVSCTIVVVLFTVFVMGGLTKPVLNLCGIPMGVPAKTKSKKVKSKARLTRLAAFVDQRVLKPTLIIDYMKPHTDGRRDSDAALAETTVAKLLAADASRESKRGVLTVPGVEMGAPRGGSLVGSSFAGQI